MYHKEVQCFFLFQNNYANGGLIGDSINKILCEVNANLSLSMQVGF